MVIYFYHNTMKISGTLNNKSMKARIIRKMSWCSKGIRNKYSRMKKRDILLVKFTDNRRRSWIGEFEMDEKDGLCKVLTFDRSPYGLVVANGRGYIVNIEERLTKNDFKKSKNIVSIMKTSNPELLIAGTENDIFTVDTDGMIYEIVPDFDARWFFLTDQTGSEVNGRIESDVNQYEKEIPFIVDLLNLELKVDY